VSADQFNHLDTKVNTYKKEIQNILNLIKQIQIDQDVLQKSISTLKHEISKFEGSMDILSIENSILEKLKKEIKSPQSQKNLPQSEKNFIESIQTSEAILNESILKLEQNEERKIYSSLSKDKTTSHEDPVGDSHLILKGSSHQVWLNALTRLLKSDSKVVVLDLSTSDLNDEAMDALAQALKWNNTIQRLYLAGNSIGDAGAEHLACALKVNNTVTYLDLSDNSVGDEGASMLAHALKFNSSLKFLKLNGNHIGNKGAQELVNSTHQVQVSIEGNQIDQGFEEMLSRIIY